MNISLLQPSVQDVYSNRDNGIQNVFSNGITGAGGTADGTEMFRNVYNSLISNVNQTDAVYQQDIIQSAAGELDNPHQLQIDAQKAEVSLQIAMSVRNKALDAYDQIIRMQV